MIYMLYHGFVDIDYWEYLGGLVYLIVLYLYFARVKNMNIGRHPEYSYFLSGLYAKVFGGICFTLIYFYYYKGGDTLSYFYSAVSMSNLAVSDPISYFKVLFGPNDAAHRNLFTMETGYPYGYVYYDPRTFFVIRWISPLVLLCLNSYLITTVVLASISYFGVWKAYRTFVSYFPQLAKKFAIAFLYFPSVVFWGSSIMKDTFTFTATCYWVHCIDEIFFKRRFYISKGIGLVISGVALVMVKPYIFMALFPATVLWLLFYPVARIKNVLFRFAVLPISLSIMLGISLVVLKNMDSELDKFSLDNSLQTIQIIQSDMKRSEQYGDNYFDIGATDGSWAGMLSKYPVASFAAIYRPQLNEVSNIVMVLSAVENTWLLAFTLILLFRTKVWFFLRCMMGNPLVLMCLVFTLVFAFVIGISTPNFGALVRFKIPMVPFLVSALFIIEHFNRLRVGARQRHKQFRLLDHIKGTLPARVVPAHSPKS